MGICVSSGVESTLKEPVVVTNVNNDQKSNVQDVEDEAQDDKVGQPKEQNEIRSETSNMSDAEETKLLDPVTDHDLNNFCSGVTFVSTREYNFMNPVAFTDINNKEWILFLESRAIVLGSKLQISGFVYDTENERRHYFTEKLELAVDSYQKSNESFARWHEKFECFVLDDENHMIYILDTKKMTHYSTGYTFPYNQYRYKNSHDTTQYLYSMIRLDVTNLFVNPIQTNNRFNIQYRLKYVGRTAIKLHEKKKLDHEVNVSDIVKSHKYFPQFGTNHEMFVIDNYIHIIGGEYTAQHHIFDILKNKLVLFDQDICFNCINSGNRNSILKRKHHIATTNPITSSKVSNASLISNSIVVCYCDRLKQMVLFGPEFKSQQCSNVFYRHTDCKLLVYGYIRQYNIEFDDMFIPLDIRNLIYKHYFELDSSLPWKVSKINGDRNQNDKIRNNKKKCCLSLKFGYCLIEKLIFIADSVNGIYIFDIENNTLRKISKNRIQFEYLVCSKKDNRIYFFSSQYYQVKNVNIEQLLHMNLPWKG